MSSLSTIDRAVTLFAVFNQHQNPAIPYQLLTDEQKRGWCAVAEYMANDNPELRIMDKINVSMRDRLFSIMQQIGDELDIEIDVDRY